MKKYVIAALLVAAPVYAQEAPSGDGRFCTGRPIATTSRRPTSCFVAAPM